MSNDSLWGKELSLESGTFGFEIQTGHLPVLTSAKLAQFFQLPSPYMGHFAESCVFEGDNRWKMPDTMPVVLESERARLLYGSLVTLPLIGV